MYAKHIDRLEGLGNLPAQIVHKHVSLQVQPAHYPIVGACLLRARRMHDLERDFDAVP